MLNGKVRCETCPWFERNAPQPGPPPESIQGTCLYNPPVPMFVPVPQTLARPGQAGFNPGAMGLRPPTQGHHRCHHHPEWHNTLQ